MRLHREKVAAFVAVLAAVWGLYGVVLGFVDRGPGIQVPDIGIPEAVGSSERPEYRKFQAQPEGLRDPFSVAEGWQRISPPPIAEPPYGPRPRLFPSLGRGASGIEAGFLFRPAPPVAKSGSVSTGAPAADGEEGE